METFTSNKGYNKHTFEMVDSIPYGYKIWNIGNNIEDDYLPLVQTGGYDGCQVVGVMKVMKVKDAQKVLSAIGWGQNTISEMETYVKRYRNSKTASTRSHVQKLKDALQVMRSIKGIEKLEQNNQN